MGKNRQHYKDVGGFNISLLAMHRSCKQKIKNDMLELNQALDQTKLRDI